MARGGWVGSGALWAAPFETLSRSWRTVTQYLRGTGGGRHSAPAITFEPLVGDLFRVPDALKRDTCVLAAESMSAMAVLEAALRRPERFTGLVIVKRSNARAAAQMLECVDGIELQSWLALMTHPQWVAEQIYELYDVS